jgi:hypothetical protein
MLVKKGLQRAARPVPEREVSSHLPLLPAAAGGTSEHWKALPQIRSALSATNIYDILKP